MSAVLRERQQTVFNKN